MGALIFSPAGVGAELVLLGVPGLRDSSASMTPFWAVALPDSLVPTLGFSLSVSPPPTKSYQRLPSFRKALSQ